MIDIRIIDKSRQVDILLANQPFALTGRLIPTFDGTSWDYQVQKATQIEWQTFPDEAYDFDQLSDSHQFVGAYDGEDCVGLAILQDDFFAYSYLYDLKVNQAYRKQAIASRLLKDCQQIALSRGFRGIRTIAQDNNLAACLFYLKQGFVIGGADAHCYKGTPQEGKTDIHFYLDCL